MPQQPSDYLPLLNEAQRRAVTHPCQGGLQILAGPGSGKTKVLTTRVAYLIQEQAMLPEDIVVVTFTNKAANEMRFRLTALVGSKVMDKIIMGTFHSVCVRFLRRHSRQAGLQPNFVIASRDDALNIVKRILADVKWKPEHADTLQKEFKPKFILDFISRAKSQGRSPGACRLDGKTKSVELQKQERASLLADVYEGYEKELKTDNALDFDDLLLVGLNLIQRNEKIVASIETVLIDEFQDTNIVQYELVKALSITCRSVTIVGDPDQSIYGWRSADVGNLGKMADDFKPVTQIYLEENYRSTGGVLGAALAVVRQDTTRINKSLKATHSMGLAPVLHLAPNAFEEADFIAAQIKHLVAHTGNLLDYGDFAILLRYQALSRSIETSLQKAGIPSRVVGGHKFFDRTEVRDLLAYLQLVDSPAYTAAFVRVVNTPKRGIGEKTVREILTCARRRHLSAFEVSVKLSNGSGMVSISSGQRAGLRMFVKAVMDARTASEKGGTVADLVNLLCKEIKYTDYLEKSHGAGETDDRLENIKELQSYATAVALENPEVKIQVGSSSQDAKEQQVGVTPAEYHDRELDIIGNEDEDLITSTSSQPTASDNPLRTFLAVSMLATDSETEETTADASSRKVTISTCHAAKGLEWPVVFLPACEDGTYPFYRASDSQQVDEERRLLYVGITRAQAVCIMTHCASRMLGSETKQKTLSPFLSVAKSYPMFFVPRLHPITVKTRAELAKVLHRNPVDEGDAKIIIKQYTESLPLKTGYEQRQQQVEHRLQNTTCTLTGSEAHGSDNRLGQPVPAGFTSALASYRSASMPAAKLTRHSSSSSSMGLFPTPLASTTAASATLGISSVSSSVNDLTSRPTKPLAFVPPLRVTPVNTVVQASVPLLQTRQLPIPTSLPPGTQTKLSFPTALALATQTNPSFSAHPPVSSSSGTVSGVGSLRLPETRASRIDDVVLINPTVENPRNLLETFRRKESLAMEGIRRLGEGVEEKHDPSKDGYVERAGKRRAADDNSPKKAVSTKRPKT